MRGYSGRKLLRRNNWKVVFRRFEIPTEVGRTKEGRICDRALKMEPLFVTSGPDKHIPYSSRVNNALPYYLQGGPCPMPAGYAAIDTKSSAEKNTGTADWYRMFACLLGITVTLLSLTSLQIVNIMKWITYSPPSGQRSGESAEHDDCSFPVNSGHAALSRQPVRSRRPAAPRETSVGGITSASVASATWSSWLASETQSQVLPGCDCRTCCPDSGGNSTHGVEPLATDYLADGGPPLSESFQTDRGVWPNCPHFTDGIHQVCLLCWLNSPDLWLFGPTLPPLVNGGDHLSFCAHCGSECGFQPPVAVGSPCSTAVIGLSSALSDTGLLRHHVCHRVDMASALESGGGLLLLKRRQMESYDQTVSSVALPKCPRSSGDGAPSSSILDLSLESSGRSKDSPVIATKSDCQSTARPLFYAADSDSESSASLLHQWISTEVDLGSPSTSVGMEQLRISVSKLASKATALLQSAGCRRRLVAATSELGGERNPPIVAAAGLGSHKREETTTSGVHPGFSCFCPYDYSSETLEYDDFLPGFGSRQSLADSDTSDCQSVELNEENEAMLLSLLDTLNSLMELKHGSSPTPKRQTSQSTMVDCGGADGGKSVTRNRSLCSVVQNSFSDLSKKATDLAEDLATLEEVLDQLHYKVCANEIELANAKDNLATAWHLHDNLDSTESVSSIGGGASATSLVCSLCEDSQLSSPESSRRLSVRSNSRPTEPPPLVVQSIPSLSIAPVETGYSTEPPVLCDSAMTGSRTTTSSMTKSITESAYPSLDSASLLALPAVMTKSAPDGGQLSGEFAPAAVTTNTTTSDSLHRTSKSRRLRSARCRLHRPACSDCDVRRSQDLSCLYYSRVDPDGFLHPELTFEKDGLIDWETIVSSEKRQSELAVPFPVRGSSDAASPIL